jgi:hypothetical protein
LLEKPILAGLAKTIKIDKKKIETHPNKNFSVMQQLQPINANDFFIAIGRQVGHNSSNAPRCFSELFNA